jgi:hypothetical protein
MALMNISPRVTSVHPTDNLRRQQPVLPCVEHCTTTNPRCEPLQERLSRESENSDDSLSREPCYFPVSFSITPRENAIFLEIGSRRHAP